MLDVKSFISEMIEAVEDEDKLTSSGLIDEYLEMLTEHNQFKEEKEKVNKVNTTKADVIDDNFLSKIMNSNEDFSENVQKILNILTTDSNKLLPSPTFHKAILNCLLSNNILGKRLGTFYDTTPTDIITHSCFTICVMVMVNYFHVVNKIEFTVCHLEITEVIALLLKKASVMSIKDKVFIERMEYLFLNLGDILNTKNQFKVSEDGCLSFKINELYLITDEFN